MQCGFHWQDTFTPHILVDTLETVALSHQLLTGMLNHNNY